MKVIVSILFFLMCTSAYGEYRVFELNIINKKNKTTRKVYSTLDWIQYHEYNYLRPEEEVRLSDTWMCWRRHKRFQPLCKRPDAEATLKAENEAAGG